MKKDGKILNYLESTPNKKKREPRPTQIGGRRVARFWPTGNVPKDWIAVFLMEWCPAHGQVLQEEYFFHPTRKWRFDWVPHEELKIAIEYEGLLGYGRKTGHTDSQGYTDNTDKYNEAAALGWTLIRVTHLNYESVKEKLEKIYSNLKYGNKPTS